MTIGREGVWVCSPTKLKKKKIKNKPKAEQETAQPTAARFKNKPKAEQETAQPTAARFNKINRRQNMTVHAYGCAVKNANVRQLARGGGDGHC